MQTVFTEFDNQNEARTYPFADGSTFTSVDGLRLPNDCITDLSVHVRYPEEPDAVYVSSIDFAEGILTFSFARTGDIVGTAMFGDGASSAVIRGTLVKERIGIVIFGKGVARAAVESQLWTFKPDATALIPSVVFPIPDTGVTGIRLPDGTLMTGDIKFKGEGGVEVRTSGSRTGGRLRFDCRGESKHAWYYDRSPIVKIIFSMEEGSLIVPSLYSKGVLALASPVEVNDLCALSDINRVQGTIDAKLYPEWVCDTAEDGGTGPEPDPRYDFGPKKTIFEHTLLAYKRAMAITSLSTYDYKNPVRVSVKEHASTTANPVPIGSLRAYNRKVTAAELLDHPRGIIKIEFVGVPGSLLDDES